VEERQEPQGTGVEAGVAAGLVPSSEVASRPVDAARGVANAVIEGTEVAVPEPAPDWSSSYDLPDWTDPPTLQVPRVLLHLEQEAAAERGGPQPPPPGGPVWRERQEDWDDTDAILADLAGAGKVTAYEESSSDDPFAYDFLDLDDESSWVARIEVPTGPVDRLPPTAERLAPPADQPPAPGSRLSPSDERPAPPADQPMSAASPVEQDGPARADGGPPGAASPVGPDEVEAVPIAKRRRHAAPRSRPPRPPRPMGEAAKVPSTDAGRNPVVVTKVPSTDAGRNPVVATLTGFALAAVVLLCFFAGPPAVLAVVAVAVTLATAEFFNSLRLAGYQPATLLGLLAVPGVTVAAYFRGPVAIVTALVLFITVAMVWYLVGITRRSPVANLAATVFGFGWIGGLGAFAGLLLDPRVFPHRHGVAFMLGAMIAAVGYDVGGYAVGSRFGRHNLAPAVSPNKTWEGLIAGCVVAIGASAGITSQIHPWHLTTALGLGCIVAVVAPFGDLVESMIKRDLGVKDMGSVLPGHGGMLDRIDALLFVLPAAYYFVRLAHIG
jgi:phosphatidate cytidylyltransferase